MKYNKTLTKTWDAIGELRNKIKDTVKAQMGWRADGPFYDRVYGRVACTPAEQSAFTNALELIYKDLKKVVSISDLFPADEKKPITIE